MFEEHISPFSGSKKKQGRAPTRDKKGGAGSQNHVPNDGRLVRSGVEYSLRLMTRF
jgi:hypothetical protein